MILEELKVGRWRLTKYAEFSTKTDIPMTYKVNSRYATF